MAVRIEKDGWSISGETKDELALGVQAVQEALKGTNGQVAGRVGGNQGGRQKAAGRPKGAGSKTEEKRRKKREKWAAIALNFLKELKKHPGGITSSQIAKELKINPRAIGNVFRVVVEEMKPLSVSIDDVLSRVKVKPTDSSVTIYPRDRITQAIEQLAKHGK